MFLFLLLLTREVNSAQDTELLHKKFTLTSAYSGLWTFIEGADSAGHPEAAVGPVRGCKAGQVLKEKSKNNACPYYVFNGTLILMKNVF